MNRNSKLSLFSLIMMTIVSVDSIRNLPGTAIFGPQLIFFFVAAVFLFLLPSALISAELSSCHDDENSNDTGIYLWLKKAFGDKTAVFGIWFQWLENVIWYPAILSFLAGTVGYIINPHLVNNRYFLFFTITISFWAMTFINLRGVDLMAKLSNWCSILGLILPMAIIITLGAMWFFGGHPSQIHLTHTSILPNFHDHNIWISLTSIMLSFCGMEMVTIHAKDVHNPQRNFPRALLISCVIIACTLLFGALSIAVVVPHDNINLVAGVMQAFSNFFNYYHLTWLLPVMALSLAFGGIGSCINWIIAPTRGLLIAAQDGYMPKFLQKQNKYNAPSSLLIGQAILVTLLTSLYIFIPSINGTYWLLTVLAAQTYMLMYLLMFAAGFVLRRQSPNIQGSFKIPGGKFATYLVAFMGIIGATITFVVGFIPPTDSTIHVNYYQYELSLILGLILLTLPAVFLIRYKNNNTAEEEVREEILVEEPSI